ncbi:MAG: sortase [Anaerolineae bacterium]
MMMKTPALRLTGGLLMLVGALLLGLAGWTYVQGSLLPPPLPAGPRDPSLAAAALVAPALEAPALLLPDNRGPVSDAALPPVALTAVPTPTTLAAPRATPTATGDDMLRGALITPIATPTQTPRPTATLTQTPRSTATARSPGIPTRLRIPSIGVNAAVVPVGWNSVTRNGQTTLEWEVADFAAGWHENSAQPGDVGNVVLSGHNNIRGMVFRRLSEINVGDEITLSVGDQDFTYTVLDRFIVREKGEPLAVRQANARWIGPFADTRLTLVSCWPFTNNTHRVIVIATKY